MKHIPIEHYERAAEILRYEPETGRLIRRVTTSPTAQADDEAGTTKRSYSQVSITSNGERRLLYTHRIVWFIHHSELPDILDHIDGDPSNNRVENLRAATARQNTHNRRSRKNSSSKYLGVNWDKQNSKWYAQIRIAGKVKYLGYFTDEIDAALAYDKAAREHFGEFANPNFPLNA